MLRFRLELLKNRLFKGGKRRMIDATSFDATSTTEDEPQDADKDVILAQWTTGNAQLREGIGEALSLTPDRVDLQRRRLCFNLSKTDEDHWRPMHDRVFVALANLPRRDDRVFRWRTTSGPKA